MEPVVRDNPEQNRYEIHLGDQRAGVLAYKLVGDTIRLTHTEIDQSIEQRGLGSKIVVHALDDARERKLNVLPSCSFVRSYIERHPEYVDLVGSSDPRS